MSKPADRVSCYKGSVNYRITSRTEMTEHPLRQLLSRILRGGKNPSRFELAYTHRGAPEDTARIKVSEIKHLGRGWFLLADGETQIPFHRVISIKDEQSQAIIWEKRQPKN